MVKMKISTKIFLGILLLGIVFSADVISAQENFANSVRTTGDAIFYSFTEALRNFMAFLPALLGALLILVIGWIVSSFLAKLIAKGLKLIGVERAIQNAGLGTYVQRTGAKWTVSDAIALMVKWFIRLIFIQAAANVLRMPQLTTIINSIILFIPKVIVAIAIIVIGSLVAKVLATMVQGALTRMNAGNPNAIATFTRYVITGFAVIAAINQLEIAEVVVNTFYIAFVSSIALAIGLAFGLGGREVAAQMTQRWYQDGRSFTDRAKQTISNEEQNRGKRSLATQNLKEEFEEEIGTSRKR
jgi:hypothetical protein